MNKLEQLIQELCPHGVEYKKLGEVCTFKKGNSITKASIEQGTIPVIAGGLKPAYYCNQYNRTDENIVVSSSGINAGFISYWNEPIFVSDAFSIHCDISLLYKYLYYYLLILQNKIFACKKEGGIPHVYSKDIAKFLIPVPPLEIQKEIVRILDTFTELEKELENELEARKKQYEFYKSYYLINNYSEKFLYEIADYSSAKINISELNSNNYVSVENLLPNKQGKELCLNLPKTGKAIVYEKYNILIGNIRPYLRKIWFSNDCGGASNDVLVIQLKEKNVIPKFLYYILSTEDFFIYNNQNAQGSKMPRGNRAAIMNYKIPLPPLEEQERIVNILDRFDALCNDLTCGLPAEIEARRKQYAYYRNKLLTFKNISDKNIA